MHGDSSHFVLFAAFTCSPASAIVDGRLVWPPRQTTQGRREAGMFKKVLGLVAVVCFGLGAFAGYAYSGGRDAEPQFHDAKLLANAQKKLMVMTKTGAMTFTNTSLSNLTADTITVPATGTY